MVIFPEGKRIPLGQRGPAYPGVYTIHRSVPDVPIAICHIEYDRSSRPINVRVAELTSPPTNAEKIMDRIYEL